MTAPTASDLARAREALEQAARDNAPVPPWHARTILAALDAAGQAVAAEREACAKVADEWAQSKSCSHHDDNPCCHVRLGATIRDRIRARGKEAGDE